ncbi:MAG: helix-turn-helix domain-containing protein [Christensenellales bacterium]|jgi:AraC-like DNA-binding protein/mannose-6-phosphate isomerase-like protein (cupin superfamily)
MYKVYMHTQEQVLFENPEQRPIVLGLTKVSDYPNYIYSAHKHEDRCEVFYISKGHATFIIDSKTYPVKTGDIIVCDKGVVHHEEGPKDGEFEMWVCPIGNFQLKGREPNHVLWPGMPPVFSAGSKGRDIVACNEIILDACLNITKHSNIRGQGVAILMLSIVDEIISQAKEEKRPVVVKPMIQDVINYIDDNYAEQISLASLAKKFYVSADYLSHAIKKETGMSPISYLINRRLGEGQKYLLLTDYPISTIAEMVGYPNINHFSNAFKKKLGISPGQFRIKYNIFGHAKG